MGKNMRSYVDNETNDCMLKYGTGERRVNDITGVLNAQYAELVDIVVELLTDSRLWQGEGVWSMQNWLSWRCGVSTTTAKQIVVVAERADDLPISIGAFRRGELSLDQVSTVARKAPSWADEQACGFAQRMTVHQLRRTMKYPFPNLDEDGKEVADQALAVVPYLDDLNVEQDDSCSADTAGNDAAGGVAEGPSATAVSATIAEWFSQMFDDDGTFRLSFGADYETGHIFMAALTEARDALFQQGRVDVTWLDAVREVANRSLDSVSDPSRTSRFRINLYMDAESGAVNLSDAAGWNVPDAIRRHLTCDGTVTPVFLENGLPTSVGRSQRIVPERTRNIIERRDQGCCRIPGCVHTHGLEVHHIIHWEHDGETDTWNLMLICRQHHRQHHQGKLGIAGNADNPDGLVFTNQHGHPIRASGAAPNPPNAPPPQPEGIFEHPLGERLNTRWLYFNPPLAHREEITASVRQYQRYLDEQRRLHPITPPKRWGQWAS